MTFSKPMDPATVENIHNYVVKFSPTQNTTLKTCTESAWCRLSTKTNQRYPLRRATYDPATNTVLLVATEQLGSKGSYQISSPASLLAKKAGPRQSPSAHRPRGQRARSGRKRGHVLDHDQQGKTVSPPPAEPRVRELRAPSARPRDRQSRRP